MRIKVNAPAKINLYLDIKEKLDNGYHQVDMVMQSIDLFDIITIDNDNNNGDIILSQKFEFCKDKNKNTMYKAAKEFFNYTNVKNTGININLEKNIPVLAGLAGGSTDAAAVIIGLDYMFKTNLGDKEKIEIAKKIGADVAFCLFGGTMLAQGIGIELTKLNNMPMCYIVLAKPDVGVSTKEAYELSDNTPSINNTTILNLIDAIKENNLTKMAQNVYNKFEQVINFNDIENIKQIMEKYSSIVSCMSGSGSTIFGIFDKEGTAKICYKELKEKYNDTFICKPICKGCHIII